MKYIIYSITICMILITGTWYSGSQSNNEPVITEKHILVFSKTSGWRHDSIETAHEALKKSAAQHGFLVDISENADDFTESNLSRYDVVVFLNTTGEIFDDEQRNAFKAYINNGGAFAGVHSATDTENNWPWYNRLVGAWFANHPQIQQAVIEVLDPHHPSTQMLPERWERTDEWYNFRDFNENVTVLMKLDTNTFEGSDHPGDHPIAWYHEFDGGRIFYTALGHTIESYSEDLFMQHLWGGILSVTEK